MTIEIFLRISLIQTILAAAAVIMSVINFRQRGIETRLIGLIFLFEVITVVVLEVFPFKGRSVNLPQTVDVIVAFILLTLLFKRVLHDKYKLLRNVSTVLFLVFAFVNLLFFQQDDINTYSRILESIIINIYCILYFYRLLVDLPTEHLQRVPMFWYNAALMIYFSGNLFLFLFATYLVEVLHNDLLIYWSFHNIFNIVHTLIIMIGLWQDLRNTRSLSSLPSVR